LAFAGKYNHILHNKTPQSTGAVRGQVMQEYIEKRVLEICDYILESGATVRQAAGKFGVSKSTVHKDLSERLPEINKEKYEKARQILAINKAERHLRGGEATRQKYQGKKSKNGRNITCLNSKNIIE